MPDKIEEEILQLHFALENKQKEGEKNFLSVFQGESLMALIISIPLVIFQLTTAITIVITFGQKIFAGGSENSSISETMGRTLIIAWGVVRIFSSLVGGILLDLKGRRYLFIAGAAAIATNLALLSFSELVDWIILKCFLLFTFIIIFGFTLGPVLWTFVGEVLGPKCLTIAISALWIVNFIILFSYTYLADMFGNAGVFFIYACFSVAAVFFAKSMMPETAHKSRIEIRKAIIDMLGAEKEIEENEMDILNTIHEQEDEHDGQSPDISKQLLEKRFRSKNN